MLLGAPYLVYDEAFGAFWQEDQSYAFQQGQQAGRIASQVAGTALAVDGTAKIVTGLAAEGGSLAAAPVTEGVSLVIGVLALPAEVAMVATGAAEAGYGGSVLFCASRNPAPKPSYRAGNFRSNLKNRTPIPRGMKSAEAHHMLPQEFEDTFLQRGVKSIHDPKWGAWVEAADHDVLHGQGYNARWGDWLRRHPNATPTNIAAFAQQLATEYGINWP